MPIRGMTDRKRLPRVGKIHLGVREKSQKSDAEYPRPVSYFVVKEDDNTPEDMVQAFREVYGEQPDQLEVLFPSDDPGQWADANYKMYGSSWMLTCKGDGEKALAKWDVEQDGPRPEGVDSGTWANRNTKSWVYREVPCLAEECPMQLTKPPRCRAIMQLQFLMPNVRGIGVWQIDTGSWNSIQNVLNSVELIKTVTGGRIRGLRLKLRLVPKDVTPPNVKTKRVWVLDISMPDAKLEDLLAEAARLPAEGLMLLPTPVEEEAPGDLFPVAVVAAAGVEVDEETGEVKDPLLFANPGEFLTTCWQALGLNRDAVLRLLDVDSLEAIEDLEKAYYTLKERATAEGVQPPLAGKDAARTSG